MSKIVLFLFCLIVSFGCTNKKNKVYLIKQWHLSPNDITTNIEESKKLPHFENQQDIYMHTVRLINKGSLVVIAEGCEKKSKYFLETFNGWTLDKIKKNIKSPILAPVPLRIEALGRKDVSIVCGDDEQLIKKNNASFSDLKGFSNFFQRLLYYKNRDQKSFNRYKNALDNIVDLNDNDPILVAKKKALNSLAEFNNYIDKRNKSFYKAILKNMKKNPVLIIGGLHINGISKLLKKENIDYEIITPKGYPEKEEKLINDLKSILSQYGKKELRLFQVPFGMNLSKFPKDNILKKIKPPNLEIFRSFGYSEDLLKSDFDGDGIRDFTLSSNNNVYILSAEDDDWDNDGIGNLYDNTVGSIEIAPQIKESIEINNAYSVKETEINSVKSFLKGKVKLLNSKEALHDLLILKIFKEVLSKVKYPKENLKYFVATKPTISFGNQSFFSYNKQSLSIEVYPNELLDFISNKKKKSYQKVTIEKFVQGVVIPILIHSLSHELGHVLHFDSDGLAKSHGWQFINEDIHSEYLSLNRLKRKKLTQRKKGLSFRGKIYNQWLKEHQKYVNTTNLLLRKKLSPGKFKNEAKKLPWYIETNTNQKELQLSFLLHHQIPSLYALKNPDEWFAETYASCVFHKFYPRSIEPKEGIRYEVLIGFNPVVDSEICQKFM